MIIHNLSITYTTLIRNHVIKNSIEKKEDL
jgi:hypothetical protein